jgi:hypothetical protein
MRQMVELLLPRFQTTTDLSQDRFRILDGSILSWSEMMQLLFEILPLMPDPVLFVIDGLHWLDDRSTDKYLSELLSMFRGSSAKVLLTTTGRSSCLREGIMRSEALILETLGSGDAVAELDRDISRL